MKLNKVRLSKHVRRIVIFHVYDTECIMYHKKKEGLHSETSIFDGISKVLGRINGSPNIINTTLYWYCTVTIDYFASNVFCGYQT